MAFLDRYNPALELETSPPGSLPSWSPRAGTGTCQTENQTVALPSTPPARWPNSSPRPEESQLEGCSSSACAFADVRFQPSSEMQQAAEPQWCTGAEVYGARMQPDTPALRASLRGHVRALAPLQQTTQQPAQAAAEVTGVVAQLAETLESQRHQFVQDTHTVPYRQGCGAQPTPQLCAGTGLPHGQLGTASTGVASACSAVAHTDKARAGVPSLPPSCSKTGPAAHSKLLTAPQVQASCC
jgi:hypothetical protein